MSSNTLGHKNTSEKKVDLVNSSEVQIMKEEGKDFIDINVNRLEKEKFWYDVRLRLIPLRVGILTIPDVDNIEEIQLQKTIYFDGWSRDRLMNDFFIMMDASELVELLFRKFYNYMRDKVSRD